MTHLRTLKFVATLSKFDCVNLVQKLIGDATADANIGKAFPELCLSDVEKQFKPLVGIGESETLKTPKPIKKKELRRSFQTALLVLSYE